MKLPRAAEALIDERKVRGYLLSQTHPVGRFKARVFARSAEAIMNPALLDTVVLNRDLPQYDLRAGDLGAVVELYATYWRSNSSVRQAKLRHSSR